MSDVGYLLRQFDLSWKLASYHFESLTPEDCLRRPAARGLHVHQRADGTWHGDWPEHEGYDLGPSSIAWLTWHLRFWWSMVLDHSFGAATLTRDDVAWPNGAAALTASIRELHDAWRAQIAGLTAEELASTLHTRWPYTDRPFGDVVAWVNVELTKSAAEIGYVRFLYGASEVGGG